MNLLTHLRAYLRAYLARRRWRHGLLLSYPSYEEFCAELQAYYDDGYRQGLLDGARASQNPSETLRKALDRTYGEKGRGVN